MKKIIRLTAAWVAIFFSLFASIGYVHADNTFPAGFPGNSGGGGGGSYPAVTSPNSTIAITGSGTSAVTTDIAGFAGAANNTTPSKNSSGAFAWIANAVNTGVAQQIAYYGISGAQISGNAVMTITNGILSLGASNSVLGGIQFWDSGDTNSSTIQAPATGVTVVYKLPTVLPTGTTQVLNPTGTSSPIQLAWSNQSGGFSNPMTALGDMIGGGASGAATRIPVGNVGQVTTEGNAATPAFADIQSCEPSISNSPQRTMVGVCPNNNGSGAYGTFGFGSGNTTFTTTINGTNTLTTPIQADGAMLMNNACPATSGDVAGITWGNGGNTAVAYYTQLPRIWMSVKTGANTTDIQNCRIWCGVFGTNQGVFTAVYGSDTPSGENLAAFRYATGTDGTLFWRCVTGDGAALNTITTTSPIASNTKYDLAIDCSNAGRIDFYINGALVASSTTHLPGSANTESIKTLYMGNTTTTAAIINFKVHQGLISFQ